MSDDIKRDKIKKSNAGRKSKYETHVLPRLEEIKYWAREGLIEEEMCRRLGIGLSTLQEYKHKFTELAETLKTTKAIADYRVEDSLYNRARGISFIETTRELRTLKDEHGAPILNEFGYPMEELVVTKEVEKFIPPDTTAQIFWLKNRVPDRYRDKVVTEHEGNVNINPYKDMSDDEIKAKAAELARKLMQDGN